MKSIFYRSMLVGSLGLLPGVLLAQAHMETTLASLPSSAKSPVADEIVAVVNTEVITRNELRARVTSVERGLQRQGTPLPPVDVLNRQVLEHMIDERAQLQEAKDDGIRVDDSSRSTARSSTWRPPTRCRSSSFVSGSRRTVHRFRRFAMTCAIRW